MQVYATEAEQIELIKKIWNRYGTYVLSLCLAILVFVLAWQLWEKHQNKQAQMASAIYAQLLQRFSGGDLKGTAVLAKTLESQYPKSTYAVMAALFDARLSVDSGDHAKAKEALSWVIEKNHLPVYTDLARLRLAELLIDEKNEAQAKNLLAQIKEKTFLPLVLKLKGDLALMEHDINGAKMHYRQSLALLPDENVLHRILVMKLNDLNEAV